MARAILEGCSFGLRQLMNILREEYQLSPSILPAIGGGSQNRIWNQIKANVLQTVIETREVGETALMGACYLPVYRQDYLREKISLLSAVTIKLRAIYRNRKRSLYTAGILSCFKAYTHRSKIFIKRLLPYMGMNKSGERGESSEALQTCGASLGFQ